MWLLTLVILTIKSKLWRFTRNCDDLLEIVMNKRNRKFAILIAVSPSCIFNEKRMLLIVTSTFSLVLDGALNCLTSILTGFVCLFSFAAAVKLLLDMGSDINAQIETNRNTALTLACFQVTLASNFIIFCWIGVFSGDLNNGPVCYSNI